MARPSERAGSLSSAIIDLEAAAKIPAKSRATKISSLVENVCGRSFEDGLLNTSLHALIDLITLPNELDQGSIANLIKNLYPSHKVPDAIVVKIVGSLGHGRSKPSMATQGALLKWLVMIHDVLENQSILSCLYGPLFNLLDTIAIRSQLCHVLSLITRRKHVRPFRIQALMELTRQAGNDPPLVGLMRVYKDYYPDVIVGETLSGRASVFMHPNHEWRDRLHEIQDANFQKTQDGHPPTQRAFRVTRRTMNGKKGICSTVIPEVHTSNAQESSTTLEEIETVSNFVRRLEKIELPNQLVAVIGDPLLQKFLQLKSTEATLTRIDNWLLAFFEDQLQSPGSPEILPMLAAVREYTYYSKKPPPACLRYLHSMIDSWDGITGREIIMDLLSFTPIAPFEDLWQTLFQPLEEAVLEDASLEARLDLLKFYGDLIQQWSVALLSQSQQSPADGQTISGVINHANVLSLAILQNSSTVSTRSKVLGFYESITSLFTIPTLRTTVRITTPLAELIYTLYFTHCLSTLSRLCNILAVYKRAFEFAMSAKPNNPAALEQLPYPKEYVNHFNGFLMDICNCIWRARAFNTSDVNALGCLMPASLVTILGKYVSEMDTSFSLATLFSLSFSPLFSLLAISYVRELEDKDDEIVLRHAGPVTQASLKQLEKDGGLKLSWGDYRLGVLRYFENKGAMGVGELMYNTMKHLMTARDNMG